MAEEFDPVAGCCGCVVAIVMSLLLTVGGVAGGLWVYHALAR